MPTAPRLSLRIGWWAESETADNRGGTRLFRWHSWVVHACCGGCSACAIQSAAKDHRFSGHKVALACRAWDDSGDDSDSNPCGVAAAMSGAKSVSTFFPFIRPGRAAAVAAWCG